MTWNIVILPAENLFAVIACVQPRVRGNSLASQERSLAHRLAQVNRIVDNGENCDCVAVSNEMFCNCSGITLGCAVRSDPPTFDVRRRYRKYVAFEFSRGETRKRMGGIC